MNTPATMAAALLASVAQAEAETRAIVETGALHVKNEGRANALASAPARHAHAPHAITYDVAQQPTGTQAEIGYDKSKRGGALGNLLEFGGGGDHSPPHLDLERALTAEEPRFVGAFRLMAQRLL